MDLLVQRCAGVDIGKDEVVACVRTPDPTGGRRKETRTFLSFTADLGRGLDRRPGRRGGGRGDPRRGSASRSAHVGFAVGFAVVLLGRLGGEGVDQPTASSPLGSADGTASAVVGERWRARVARGGMRCARP